LILRSLKKACQAQNFAYNKKAYGMEKINSYDNCGWNCNGNHRDAGDRENCSRLFLREPIGCWFVGIIEEFDLANRNDFSGCERFGQNLNSDASRRSGKFGPALF
jgi:hypothetical protein